MQSAQPRLRRSGLSGAETAVRAWWCRLLDGAHPWGSFDAMVGRYCVRRYRLVVFPPGINAVDRWLLRLWRGWPVGGAVLIMLAVMLLGEALSSARTTFLVAAAAYLSVDALLFVLTAGVRAGVRSNSLILLTGEPDPRERQIHAE